MLNYGENLNKEVDVLIDYTSNLIENNKSKKDALTNSLTNICKNVDTINDANSSNELFTKLDALKMPLDMIYYNLNKLNESQGLLKEIQSSLSTQTSSEVESQIQNYNNVWNSSVNNIFANYVSVESFLNKANSNDTVVIHNPISENKQVEITPTVTTTTTTPTVTPDVTSTVTTDLGVQNYFGSNFEEVDDIDDESEEAENVTSKTFSAINRANGQGSHHSNYNGFRKKKHKNKR